MKKISAGLVTLLCSLSVLIYAGCVVDSDDKGLTDVTISADTTSIEADGSVTLSANVETIGSPDLSYVWAIKSGSDYAEFTTSNAQESVVLQGKNATATEQSVKVKVTVTDRTNGYTYADSVEICVGAAESVVSSVFISGTTSIAYNGTGTLTAQASTIGNPSISY
ncbi:MAG: hypothetical protein K6G80_09810, partial [Treponema sp.]|nr:hypothetical protein [Treponema sp.]